MAAALEAIFGRLLVPDNAVIKQVKIYHLSCVFILVFSTKFLLFKYEIALSDMFHERLGKFNPKIVYI